MSGTVIFFIMATISADSIEALLNKAHSENLSLTERLIYFSEIFLETEYKLGPLGEGDGVYPDTDPLYDFERVDCVTFCEQVIALSLSREGLDDFLDVLNHIRYKNGFVSFESRNHYTYLDWIPNNSWLCYDVTGDLGPLQTTQKTIDKSNFLAGHGISPSEIYTPFEIEIKYIDESDISDISLRDGDLIMIVTSRPGIDIAHWGFFFNNPKVFRHASMSKGVVTDLPWNSFISYLKGKDNFLGVVVVRLLDRPILYWREDDTSF